MSTRTHLSLLCLLTLTLTHQSARAQCAADWVQGPMSQPGITNLNAAAVLGPRVVVGGAFTQTVQGQTANNIMAFDGLQTSTFGTGTSGAILALTAFTRTTGERELVAGGS